MTSFAFVPRKLAAKPPKVTHQSPPSVTQAPVASSSSNPSKPEKAERRNELSDADYVALVCLAFSEYALWLNPDLRRTIDYADNEGFISLGKLLNSCSTLVGLGLTKSQVAIAKALRNLAAHLFDVRILLSNPSPSWTGPSFNDSTQPYEIRRKDWASAKEKVSKSKTDWDNLTVYVENIPTNHRNIIGIARCIQTLLAGQNDIERDVWIQGITLPAHHQDKPGAQPSCKGFALVTLSNSEDVDYLLKTWPWQRTSKDKEIETDTSEISNEATKFGLRVISKRDWEQLREEYLAYRQKLVDEINAFQDAQKPMTVAHDDQDIAVSSEPPPKKARLDVEVVSTQALEPGPPPLTLSSPFPYNCLVFVRHVHSETNKTTLRSLFTKTLKAIKEKDNTLDYVDYNKGMDSCHIRFSTPGPARALVDHFTSNPMAQTAGIDEACIAPDSDGAHNVAMKLEVVTGRREELYWEKVPEKIRKQAVQKAIALSSGVDGSEAKTIPLDPATGGGGAKKRKRRK
ncbi:hypothetical protein BDN72DRAFT_857727 [Pluteus cervinus]|uniref:Uncharacterized protein n=1 Tax=Pluteus cervinus TaxID=181527 RepID=A0ACD3AUK9_9AGAR|nr:hypothetical protein BDN72DRAFT_857727 [Pluteus cervinus]